MQHAGAGVVGRDDVELRVRQQGDVAGCVQKRPGGLLAGAERLLRTLAVGDVGKDRHGGLDGGVGVVEDRLGVDEDPPVPTESGVEDAGDHVAERLARAERHQRGARVHGEWRAVGMDGVPAWVGRACGPHLFQCQAEQLLCRLVGFHGPAVLAENQYPAGNGVVQAPLALEALAQLLLRSLDVGDVDREAHDAQNPAVLVSDGDGVVANPAHLAAGPDNPVLNRAGSLRRRRHEAGKAGSVLGVHEGQDRAPGRTQRLQGPAVHSLERRADVERLSTVN